MATVFVYNNDTNDIETYFRNENEALPYNIGNTLTVREFRGSSNSTVFWTDKLTMETWNNFSNIWGQPIYVGFAFKRIWEGGHDAQSQHYAGVSFDVGQNLSPTVRNSLRETAENSGLWSYVEPGYLTPTWVHFDKRMGPPACSAGYPMLQMNSINQYVFILQDALNAIGYVGSGLDGIFGGGTEASVLSFQRAQGLADDGIVGCSTWTQLTQLALGIGLTNTVLMP